MKNLILNLFLLVLGISLDFSPNIGQKSGEFFKILPEKLFKFVLSRKDGTIIFNLGLMLLLVKVDLILKK